MSTEANKSLLDIVRVAGLLAARETDTANLRSVADVHGVVQLPPTQGWHADRDHRGGLSQRTQADAAA